MRFDSERCLRNLRADIYHYKPIVHFLIWQEIMKYMYLLACRYYLSQIYFPTGQEVHVKLFVYGTCILSISLSLIIILLKDKGYAPDAVLKYLTLVGGGYTQTVDNSIEYDSLEDLVTKVHIYMHVTI